MRWIFPLLHPLPRLHPLSFPHDFPCFSSPAFSFLLPHVSTVNRSHWRVKQMGLGKTRFHPVRSFSSFFLLSFRGK